jgi:hypothetical protein
MLDDKELCPVCKTRLRQFWFRNFNGVVYRKAYCKKCEPIGETRPKKFGIDGKPIP